MHQEASLGYKETCNRVEVYHFNYYYPAFRLLCNHVLAKLINLRWIQSRSCHNIDADMIYVLTGHGCIVFIRPTVKADVNGSKMSA